MTSPRPRLRALLLAGATLAVAWACTDDRLTGPLARRVASIILQRGALKTPYVLAGASARIDTVRIILKRADSTVVLDTSIFVPVGADSLKFSYDLPITGSTTFGATLQYKSLGVVLFQSAGVVTASTPGSAPGTGVVDVPPLLIGPGSNARTVSILPRDTVLSFGGSVTYRTTARDAATNPITPFLSVLSTSDPSVPIAANGQVSAPALRRTIWVKVLIPLATPVVDSTRVTFAPVPVTLRVQRGDAQAGTVGIALTQPIVARVLAADSIGVAGVSVTFTTSTPGAVISTPTVVTDSAGDAITVVTLGPLAGAQGFTATSTVGARTFAATANPGAPNVMTIAGGNGRTVVAGTPVDTVPIVRVTDGFGNPVAGATVLFSVLTGGGSLTGATALTNVAGIAAPAAWTLGATAGANTVRATLGALPPLTFNATGVAGPPAVVIKVRGDAITRTVGAAVDSTPRLRVTDAGGNAVSGTAVNFSALTGGGSVTGTTPVTDVNGFAAIGSWTLGTVVGANTIRATVGALPQVTFTISGAAAGATVIVKDGGDLRVASVGTPTDTAPGVLITDAFANPVAGVSVAFAVTGGGGTIAGGTVLTNAAGKARATSWTLGAVAGANSATATAGALPVLTFTATGTAGAPSALAIVVGNAQSAIVGTAVSVPPQVRLTDGLGNAVVGAAVTFAVTGGGGSVTGGTTTTDASGFATVGSWTLGLASGANTLQVSSAGVSPVTFTATGLAGAATTVVIVSGNAQSALVNTALATPVVVAVRDANANPIAGVSVTFAIASGGGSLTGASATTGVTGQATLGSWTLGVVAGVNTLTATAPTLTPVTFTATGIAGSPAVIVFVSDSVPPGTVGTAISPPPTVQVQDLFANPVAGATVAFAVTAGGGSVVPATVLTNVAGIAAVTSWTLGNAAGVQSLQASVSGVGTPKTFLATALPGPAATITKTAGDGLSSPTGAPFSVPPRVRVTDSFGNGVPGATVTFAAVGGTSVIVGGTVATTGAGDAQPTSWTPSQSGPVSATASTPGATTVTFTGTGTVSGVPQLLVESGAIQYVRAGSSRLTSSIVVRALDGNGTPVPGIGVAISATASGSGAIAGVGGALLTDATGRITLSNFPVGSATGTITISFVPPSSFTPALAFAVVVGGPAIMTATGTDGQSGNAGDTLSAPLTVQLLDASFNPVPLQPVTFAVGGSNVAGSSVAIASAVYTVLSDSTGAASLRLPLPATSGTVRVTASTAGLPSVSFTATALPLPGTGTPVRLEILNGTLRARAGSNLGQPILARYRLADGSVLVGRRVWYRVNRSDGTVQDTISVVTDAQGIATIAPIFVGDSAGSAEVRVEDLTLNLGCGFLGSTATISVSGSPAVVELVGGDNQTGSVGQDLAQPVRVRILDVAGRPIAGEAVSWVSTFPSPAGGSVPGRFGVATTDNFGVATIVFRLGPNVGINRMTISVPGVVPSLVITAGGT